MVRLGVYAGASTAIATAVLVHALGSRGQFYPAARYLATSKVSLVALLNMALVAVCGAWQLIKTIFLGKLREAEVERLNEQLWRELMEILFAVTIFRQELNVAFVAMVTTLLSVKAFHWLLQKRVEYMETMPSVPRLSHARIVLFIAVLFCTDAFFFHRSFSHILSTKTSSVALFFAFEYVILATSTIATFVKYAFYICDIILEGQWESKAVFTFYLELIRDLLHLSLYLVFFCVIFINYGLPLHLIRELYETFRNFRARVADFIRYRKVTSNMQDRFPDVTAEELSRSDATCIICREEMSSAKKLQCGHLFHVHCLRSWLERQQTCPTCRSPVIASEDGTHPPQPAQPQLPEVRDPTTENQGRARQAQQGPTVETVNGWSNYGPHQAAAAAAASQYMASIAYPAFHVPPTNARRNGYAMKTRRNLFYILIMWCTAYTMGAGHPPACMYLVPAAWLPNMAPSHANGQGEPTPNVAGIAPNVAGTSQGQIGLPFYPLFGGVTPLSYGQMANGSGSSQAVAANATNQTMTALHQQQYQLQQYIEAVQQQLERNAKLQTQFTTTTDDARSFERNASSDPEAKLGMDLKGKAPMNNDGDL